MMVLPFPELSQPDSAYLKLAETVYVDPGYGAPWQDQLAIHAKKSKRTVRRWLDGESLPGPVRAMILAHAKCQRYGIEF
jgi:hypothetical protein